MSTPKKAESEKKKVGRKEILITDDMIAQAESLAGQGMTTEQIATALGLGVSTIYEKFEKFPELAEAIKKGKAVGIAVVTEKLLEKAMAMDTASIIFYLKCQAGWREQPQQVAITGADGAPLLPSLTVNFIDSADDSAG